jgi:hypothetical protein
LTGCSQGDSKDPAAAHGKAPVAGPSEPEAIST